MVDPESPLVPPGVVGVIGLADPVGDYRSHPEDGGWDVHHTDVRGVFVVGRKVPDHDTNYGGGIGLAPVAGFVVGVELR